MSHKARGMGTVYQQPGSAHWWIQYWLNGKRIRESSFSEKKANAVFLLRSRISDMEQGKAVGPEVNKTTFTDLMEILKSHYAVNGHSIYLPAKIKHLGAMFGRDLATQITGDRLVRYTELRLKDGAKPSTVNREMALLRRAFNLARRVGRVYAVPYFPMLKEDNARKGFFEQEHLEALVKHLPYYLQPVICTAYITGWRTRSELLTRKRMHLDMEAGWLRLDPGETKNGRGRMFPLTEDLRAILKVQLAQTQTIERERGMIIPWLFHNNGRQIKDYYGAWRAACRAAGLPSKIPHDFRRSAVRNLERSGVSRSAAMQMTGHLTESVYRRYAIVDEGMMQEAAEKLQRLHNG